MDKNRDYIFEHLWKYFEIHAQQRMTVFNYYIVIAGATITGIGFCLQQGANYNFMTAALGFFLMFTSFLFWKLDKRVSELIKEVESALIEFESNIITNKYQLFTNDKNNISLSSSFSSSWSFGRCFRYAFSIMGYIGFIMIFLPFFINLKM
ncbi:hypothetical protein ABLU99_24440 [Klebsiella sp. JN_Kp123]|uniref:hypothetical protein n=1 Tax=Klebsiella sp. JN_Kp123 TaxID=3153436 RepID=UPI0032B38DFE